jgi:hypothetical protein
LASSSHWCIGRIVHQYRPTLTGFMLDASSHNFLPSRSSWVSIRRKKMTCSEKKKKKEQ